MSWLDSITDGLGDIGNMFGGSAVGKGEDAFFQGGQQTKEFQDFLKKLMEANMGNLGGLAGDSQANMQRYEDAVNQYKQSAEQGLNANNEEYLKQQKAMETKLANSGYKAGTNKVYGDMQGNLASKKALTDEQIRNQMNNNILGAEQGLYSAGNQGIGQLANIYNSMFGNQMGAGGSGYNAGIGWNNALGQHYQNEASANKGMWGNIMKGIGGFFGG